MMAQSQAESTRDTYDYRQCINQFSLNMIKAIREYEWIQKKICRQKMSMFNEICINEEMLPKYMNKGDKTNRNIFFFMLLILLLLLMCFDLRSLSGVRFWRKEKYATKEMTKNVVVMWHIHLLTESHLLVQIFSIDIYIIYREGTWLMSFSFCLEGAHFQVSLE